MSSPTQSPRPSPPAGDADSDGFAAAAAAAALAAAGSIPSDSTSSASRATSSATAASGGSGGSAPSTGRNGGMAPAPPAVAPTPTPPSKGAPHPPALPPSRPPGGGGPTPPGSGRGSGRSPRRPQFGASTADVSGASQPPPIAHPPSAPPPAPPAPSESDVVSTAPPAAASTVAGGAEESSSRSKSRSKSSSKSSTKSSSRRSDGSVSATPGTIATVDATGGEAALDTPAVILSPAEPVPVPSAGNPTAPASPPTPRDQDPAIHSAIDAASPLPTPPTAGAVPIGGVAVGQLEAPSAHGSTTEGGDPSALLAAAPELRGFSAVPTVVVDQSPAPDDEVDRHASASVRSHSGRGSALSEAALASARAERSGSAGGPGFAAALAPFAQQSEDMVNYASMLDVTDAPAAAADTTGLSSIAHVPLDAIPSAPASSRVQDAPPAAAVVVPAPSSSDPTSASPSAPASTVQSARRSSTSTRDSRKEKKEKKSKKEKKDKRDKRGSESGPADSAYTAGPPPTLAPLDPSVLTAGGAPASAALDTTAPVSAVSTVTTTPPRTNWRRRGLGDASAATAASEPSQATLDPTAAADAAALRRARRSERSRVIESLESPGAVGAAAGAVRFEEPPPEGGPPGDDDDPKPDALTMASHSDDTPIETIADLKTAAEKFKTDVDIHDLVNMEPVMNPFPTWLGLLSNRKLYTAPVRNQAQHPTAGHALASSIQEDATEADRLAMAACAGADAGLFGIRAATVEGFMPDAHERHRQPPPQWLMRGAAALQTQGLSAELHKKHVELAAQSAAFGPRLDKDGFDGTQSSEYPSAVTSARWGLYQRAVSQDHFSAGPLTQGPLRRDAQNRPVTPALTDASAGTGAAPPQVDTTAVPAVDAGVEGGELGHSTIEMAALSAEQSSVLPAIATLSTQSAHPHGPPQGFQPAASLGPHDAQDGQLSTGRPRPPSPPFSLDAAPADHSDGAAFGATAPRHSSVALLDRDYFSCPALHEDFICASEHLDQPDLTLLAEGVEPISAAQQRTHHEGDTELARVITLNVGTVRYRAHPDFTPEHVAASALLDAYARYRMLVNNLDPTQKCRRTLRRLRDGCEQAVEQQPEDGALRQELKHLDSAMVEAAALEQLCLESMHKAWVEIRRCRGADRDRSGSVSALNNARESRGRAASPLSFTEGDADVDGSDDAPGSSPTLDPAGTPTTLQPRPFPESAASASGVSAGGGSSHTVPVAIPKGSKTSRPSKLHFTLVKENDSLPSGVEDYVGAPGQDILEFTPTVHGDNALLVPVARELARQQQKPQHPGTAKVVVVKLFAKSSPLLPAQLVAVTEPRALDPTFAAHFNETFEVHTKHEPREIFLQLCDATAADDDFGAAYSATKMRTSATSGGGNGQPSAGHLTSRASIAGGDGVTTSGATTARRPSEAPAGFGLGGLRLRYPFGQRGAQAAVQPPLPVLATVQVPPALMSQTHILEFRTGEKFGASEESVKDICGAVSISTSWATAAGLTVERIEDLFLSGEADPLDPKHAALVGILRHRAGLDGKGAAAQNTSSGARIVKQNVLRPRPLNEQQMAACAAPSSVQARSAMSQSLPNETPRDADVASAVSGSRHGAGDHEKPESELTDKERRKKEKKEKKERKRRLADGATESAASESSKKTDGSRQSSEPPSDLASPVPRPRRADVSDGVMSPHRALSPGVNASNTTVVGASLVLEEPANAAEEAIQNDARLRLLRQRWELRSKQRTPNDMFDAELPKTRIPATALEAQQLIRTTNRRLAADAEELQKENALRASVPGAVISGLDSNVKNWQARIKALKLRQRMKKESDLERLAKAMYLPPVPTFRRIIEKIKAWLVPESKLNPTRQERPDAADIDREKLKEDQSSKITCHVMKAEGLPLRSDGTPLSVFVEVGFVSDKLRTATQAPSGSMDSVMWYQSVDLPFQPDDFEEQTLGLIDDDVVFSVYDEIHVGLPIDPVEVQGTRAPHPALSPQFVPGAVGGAFSPAASMAAALSPGQSMRPGSMAGDFNAMSMPPVAGDQAGLAQPAAQQDQELPTTQGAVTHYRTERRLLGTVRIPFYTVYNSAKASVEGKFSIDLPRLWMGYEPQPSRGPQIAGDGGMPPPQAFLTLYVSLWPPLAAAAKPKPTPEDSAATISILPVSPQMHQLHAQALAWRSVCQKAVEQVAAANPLAGRREFDPFVDNSAGDPVLICRYISQRGVTPLPPGVTTVPQAIRLVSLLPFCVDMLAWSNEVDVWSTNAEFLEIGAGDYEEFGLLLLHIIRSVDPDMPSFLVTGTGDVYEQATFVLILMNQRWLLIDPRTGSVHGTEDPSVGLTEVSMVVSHDQVWGNVQLSGSPFRMSWVLDDPRAWVPMFKMTPVQSERPAGRGSTSAAAGAELSLSGSPELSMQHSQAVAAFQAQTHGRPVVECVQRPVLTWPEPLSDDQCRTMEVDLKRKLRHCLREWRGGRAVSLQERVGTLLKEMLVAVEDERCNFASFPQMATQQQHAQAMSEFSQEYTAVGSPVMAAMNDDPTMAAVIRKVRDTAVHEVGGPKGGSGVKFAIGTHVRPYLGDHCAIWAFVVALTPKR